MSPKPITAARETAPRSGLAGAVGLGVIIPESDPLDADGKGWMGPDGYKLEGPSCGATWRRGGTACAPDAVDLPAGASRFAHGPDSFPFTVGASLHCSTFGVDHDLAGWHAETDRLLELCQWSEIAEELWTGQIAQEEGWENRRLASPDAELVTSATTPVTFTEAIAALEDNLAVCTCGAVHVIHVPYRAVAYLSNLMLVSRVGDRLFTANGTLVVADRGYPGTGPDGSLPDPGTTWLYGTPVLTARLGPVDHPQTEIQQTIDYKTNNQQVRSTRLAAISWLCCHFAAFASVC